MKMRLRLSLGSGGGGIISQAITATITPAMSALYEGQTVGDVIGYATMIDPANYTSPGNTITNVSVAFTGVANAAEATSEDDVVGFTVTVTDSAANQRIFNAGTTTVEYKANVTVTAGNEANIEINPIVPDSENIDVVVVGGVYAGTYTRTAGQLRGGALNLVLPSISGNTGLGDTLTLATGLWTTTSTLALTQQWKSDGTDISGATGLTFDITASEQGTNVTADVTGDDGTNPPTVATSLPVSIPAGGAANLIDITPAALAIPFNDTGSGATSETVDSTGVAAGDLIVITMCGQDATNGGEITSMTLGGQPATRLGIALDNANRRGLGEAWTVAKPATGGDSHTLVINYSEALNHKSIKVTAVPGRTGTPTAFIDARNTGNPISTTLNVGVGDALIAFGAIFENGQGPTITWSGMTVPDAGQLPPAPSTANTQWYFGTENVATADASRLIEATTSHLSIRAVGFIHVPLT